MTLVNAAWKLIKTIKYLLKPERYFIEFSESGILKFLSPLFVFFGSISTFNKIAEYLNVPVSGSNVDVFMNNIILVFLMLPVTIVIVKKFTALDGKAKILLAGFLFQAIFFSIFSIVGIATYKLIPVDVIRNLTQTLLLPGVSTVYLLFLVMRLKGQNQTDKGKLTVGFTVLGGILYISLVTTWILPFLYNIWDKFKSFV